ncbi:MAG: PIN domain-containing protein [Actinomycetota bacterium]
MIAYFDTSALLTFVLREDGRDVALDIWERAQTVVTSQLTYPEARAALAAARRAGRLDTGGYRESVRRIDERWRQLAAVDLDGGMATHAGALAEDHGLTGADAVHLAAALALRTADLVFVSWDGRLVKGALATGLPVTPDSAAP